MLNLDGVPAVFDVTYIAKVYPYLLLVANAESINPAEYKLAREPKFPLPLTAWYVA